MIVRKATRTVNAGQRIGILGANGQGKSTLVKTVARVLAPLGGTVTEGKGLSIGYFAQQELDVLRPQDNPLEHMVRLAKEALPEGESGREQDLRNYLGSFNFTGDMVKQPVGTMSGRITSYNVCYTKLLRLEPEPILSSAAAEEKNCLK